MLAFWFVLWLAASAHPLVVATWSEGGINPREERLAFFADGRVMGEVRSLIPGQAHTWFGHLDGEGQKTLAGLLREANQAHWPAKLNHASGAQVAFTVTLRWWSGGSVREVSGFTFGHPPLPESFTRLVQALRELAERARNRSAP
ncbi:MAG: hypothetical protein N2447_02010 [Thermoanaerobaculum sp.]|nr:hypothetical protein [Thermoanaerobaculum sp.]